MTCCRIETDRLLLRSLSEADCDALHAIWTHPLVRCYLWDDRVISEEETASILRRNVCMFREHGFGIWGIRLPDTHDLVGFSGYWFFREPPELELLFGLSPEHWGQGLATEAGGALIRFVFEELEFTEVRASTDAPNLAALGVLERLGMSFECRSTVAGLDTIFYSLPRTQWQSIDIR